MYAVKTTSSFDKDIKKLDRQIAKRIVNKIEIWAVDSPLSANYLKYMPNDLAGLRKIRIGDWRVLFWLDEQKEEIVLYSVDHRRDVYRKLGR
ncbi:MAG: type II toxin-antitoxin system RelE/ParE family toxin [bacterium]|nr:type II toxin-antitoxin system RelE/ParE family toxin [bacterium]